MSAAASCSFPDSSPSTSTIVDCVFGYSPSVGAASLFLALFILLACAHALLAVRARSFLGAGLTLICTTELLGFAIRLGVVHSWSTSAFIAMTVLLIISASLIGLANYTLIGRVVKMASGIDPTPASLSSFSPRSHLSLRVLLQPLLPDGRINPDFVSRFFSLLQLLSVILQIIGITDLTSSSSTPDDVSQGQHLLIAGLSIQLFTYACFFAVTLFVRLSPAYDFHQGAGQWPAMHRLLSIMMATMTLLTMRGIYRLIQYATGSDSSISRTEAPFYTCDALLVFLAMLTFAALDIAGSANRAEEEFHASHNSKQQQPQGTSMTVTGGDAV